MTDMISNESRKRKFEQESDDDDKEDNNKKVKMNEDVNAKFVSSAHLDNENSMVSFYENHGLNLEEVYLIFNYDFNEYTEDEIYWNTCTLPVPEGYTREKVVEFIKNELSIPEPSKLVRDPDYYLAMMIEETKKIPPNRNLARTVIRNKIIKKRKKVSKFVVSSVSSSNSPIDQGMDNNLSEDFSSNNGFTDSQIIKATQQIEQKYEIQKCYDYIVRYSR